MQPRVPPTATQHGTEPRQKALFPDSTGRLPALPGHGPHLTQAVKRIISLFLLTVEKASLDGIRDSQLVRVQRMSMQCSAINGTFISYACQEAHRTGVERCKSQVGEGWGGTVSSERDRTTRLRNS